jgi:hypothetical protein
MIAGRQCSHREPGPVRTSAPLSDYYEVSRESSQIGDGARAKLLGTGKLGELRGSVNAKVLVRVFAPHTPAGREGAPGGNVARTCVELNRSRHVGI